MITPEIKAFIKKQISDGVSREIISQQLKLGNWTDVDIAEAFAATLAEAPAPKKADNMMMVMLVGSAFFILAGLIILAWVFLS